MPRFHPKADATICPTVNLIFPTGRSHREDVHLSQMMSVLGGENQSQDAMMRSKTQTVGTEREMAQDQTAIEAADGMTMKIVQ